MIKLPVQMMNGFSSTALANHRHQNEPRRIKIQIPAKMRRLLNNVYPKEGKFPID